MEIIFELLIKALIELFVPVAEFIFEILVEFIFAALFFALESLFNKAFGTKSAPFAILALGNGLMGAFGGFLSLIFLPQLILHDTWLRVANMVGTPLIAAGLIAFASFLFDGNKIQRTLLETYLRAFFFVFFFIFSRAYFGLALALPLPPPPQHAAPESSQAPLRQPTQPPMPNLMDPAYKTPRPDYFPPPPEPDSATSGKRITLEDLKIPQEPRSGP